MALGRRSAAAGLLALLLSGCAAPGVTATGSAHVLLPAGRQIQYLSADVRSLKVTITRQATGETFVRSFAGSALVPTADGSRLGFSADNLAPGTYLATAEAFLDAAETVSIGRTSSAPFEVAANATTPVTLPRLVLAATPVGDWRMTVQVQTSGGYTVTDHASQLQTPDGATVNGPSGSTLAATNTFTWGNVALYPAGIATSSLTVTATRRNGTKVTKSQVATLSIVAGATVSSSVTFLFP